MAQMPLMPGAMDPTQLQAAMLQHLHMSGMPSPYMPTEPTSAPMPDPAMTQAYAAQMFHTLQAMAGQNAGLPGMPSMYPTAPQPAVEPTVSVSVEGMKFQYQLTEDDIQKVFSRYGAVKRITVDDSGNSAQITFHTAQDAQAAMADLDGKLLHGLDGTLRLKWVSGTEVPSIAPTYAGIPFQGGFGLPTGPAAASWFSGGQTADSNAAIVADPGVTGPTNPAVQVTAAGGKVLRKYTCRFLIGIENDKEFQVARRLIGAKGANMKRIVRQTDAKLRLRGQGSGYLEGAGQKESSEALQLCISCTSFEGYGAAVKYVEDLLKGVYEEYKQFCRQKGLPVPDLQVNLSENQLVYSGNGAASDMDKAPKAGKSRSRNRGGSNSGGKAKLAGDNDRGEPGPNAPPPDQIEQLINERNEARRSGNFSEADRIRDSLHQRGVALMDEPGGRGKGAEVTTWRYWRD